MTPLTGLNRRRFLSRSAAATAAAFAFPYVGSVLGANERIQIGCIGVGGKGSSDTDDAARCGGTIVGLCDVDRNTLAQKGQKYPKAQQFQDFRKMFDQIGKSIDAVTISTPDHVHGIAAATAMRLASTSTVRSRSPRQSMKPVSCDSWPATESWPPKWATKAAPAAAYVARSK